MDNPNFIAGKLLNFDFFNLRNANGAYPVTLLQQFTFLLCAIVLVPDLMANLLGEILAFLTESTCRDLNVPSAAGEHRESHFLAGLNRI